MRGEWFSIQGCGLPRKAETPGRSDVMSRPSFIRPAARAAIWRWREVLTGGAVVTLGAVWILGPGGLLGWLGWGLVAAGAGLLVIGLQRVRFRAGSGGPGIVTVDEGRITYFGPLTGGVVSMSEIERLTLDPTGRPSHWVLWQPGQPTLSIPVNAEGNEVLFDVFSTLPGLRTETMLAALSGHSGDPVVIWQRGPAHLGDRRLR